MNGAAPLRRSAAPAPAPAPRRALRPDLRVVETAAAEAPDPSIIGRVGVTMLVLLFAAVFGLVVFQAVLAQSQRQLDDLRRELSSQEAEAKTLRLQLADAAAPDRVAAAARSRLGLIPPDAVVYLEPAPGDDAKATYDPAKEPTTTTTAVPAWTPPTTVKRWTPPTTAAAKR